MRTKCFAVLLIMTHNGNNYKIDYAEAEPYSCKTDNPVHCSEHFSSLELADISAFTAFRNIVILLVQLIARLVRYGNSAMNTNSGIVRNPAP